MTDIVAECVGSHSKPKWTDELTAKIKLLWQTKSATEISSILFEQDGVTVTRNAIIGKLHRLNLGANNKRVVHAQTRDDLGKKPPTLANHSDGKQRIPRTAVNINSVNAARGRMAPDLFRMTPLPFIVSAAPADASPQHIAFGDLTALTCKWPSGSGNASEFTFCGDRPVKGKPYCLAHCRISYVPPAKRTGRGIAA